MGKLRKEIVKVLEFVKENDMKYKHNEFCEIFSNVDTRALFDEDKYLDIRSIETKAGYESFVTLSDKGKNALYEHYDEIKKEEKEEAHNSKSIKLSKKGIWWTIFGIIIGIIVAITLYFLQNNLILP